MNIARQKLKPWFRVLGLLLFVYALTWIDLSDLKLLLVRVEPVPFLFGLILLVPLIVLRYHRWYYIIQTEIGTIPWREGLAVHIGSFGLGMLTPGRVGEFAKAFYLKKSGARMGVAVFTVLFDRLSDMLVIVAVGGVGIFWFFPEMEIRIVWSILVIGFFIIVALILSHKVGTNVKVKWLTFFLPARMRAAIGEGIGIVLDRFSKIGTRRWAVTLGFSVAAWMVFCVMLYLFGMALGGSASFVELAVMGAAAQLVVLIPISISGLGTRELTLIILAQRIGESAEFGLLFSLAILLTVILFGIAGAAVLFLRPSYFTGARNAALAGSLTSTEIKSSETEGKG